MGYDKNRFKALASTTRLLFSKTSVECIYLYILNTRKSRPGWGLNKTVFVPG
jgi:hypothetical protein